MKRRSRGREKNENERIILIEKQKLIIRPNHTIPYTIETKTNKTKHNK